jgi:hypothetical protein
MEISKKKKSNTLFIIITIISYIINCFFALRGLRDDEGIYRVIAGILFGLLIIAVFIFISFMISKSKEKSNENISDSTSHISNSDCEFPALFKQKGIIGLQEENKNDTSKVVKKLSEAKHSVMIIAYYGDRLLNNMETLLIKVINSGANVQLLIAKEDSELLKEVTKLEDTRKIDRSENIRKIINEIESRTKGATASIEWREFNTQVRYSLIAVDGEWAWWTPYHTGINTEDTISFELVKTKGEPFIDLCVGHFLKLWRECPRGS